MKNNMVECKNVTYRYENNEDKTFNLALDDININVPKGEFLVILGRNGSGKSTFAKHINAPVSYTHLTLPTKA